MNPFKSALEVIDAQQPGVLEIAEKLAATVPWHQVFTIIIQALTAYNPTIGPFAAYLQKLIDALFPVQASAK